MSAGRTASVARTVGSNTIPLMRWNPQGFESHDEKPRAKPTVFKGRAVPGPMSGGLHIYTVRASYLDPRPAGSLSPWVGQRSSLAVPVVYVERRPLRSEEPSEIGCAQGDDRF